MQEAPPEAPVVFRADLGIDDYREAYWRRRTIFASWLSSTVCSAVFILGANYVVVRHGFSTPTVFLSLAGAAIVGAIIVCVWHEWASEKALRAHRKVGELRFEFDDSGMRCENELAQSKTSWNAFSHAIETKRLFLIGLQGGAFVMVPKRGMVGARLADFRSMLVRVFGTRAKIASE